MGKSIEEMEALFAEASAPRAAVRWFAVGEMVSADDAARFLGSPSAGGGWFTADSGQLVYICDGSHRDGSRGFKVLQIGGLR